MLTDRTENQGSRMYTFFSGLKQSIYNTVFPKPLRIVLIGETGVGKSTLGNVLLDNNATSERFSTSALFESCTQKLKEAEGHWLNNPKRRKIIMTDTPGLNDANQEDENIVEKMIPQIRKMGYITAVVLVFNGQNPRFTEAHNRMIQVYRSVFGIDLVKNMLLVFTNWAMDETSERKREVTGDSQDRKNSEFNKKISEIFENAPNVPCFFLDSLDYTQQGENWTKHEDVIEALIKRVETLVSFDTVDLKDLMDKMTTVRVRLTHARRFAVENKLSQDIVNLIEEAETMATDDDAINSRILKGSAKIKEVDESIKTQSKLKYIRIILTKSEVIAAFGAVAAGAFMLAKVLIK